jgi:hypothetical protein
MAHSGTRRKRPARPRFRSERAVFPGCGRCWVRTNEGLADGFTDRSLHPRHMPLTCTYVLRGAFPGRRRPLYVRARRISGAVRATDRAQKSTDGTGGSGYADRPARFLSADLPFQDACALSSRGSAGSGPQPSRSSPSSSWAARASCDGWVRMPRRLAMVLPGSETTMKASPAADGGDGCIGHGRRRHLLRGVFRRIGPSRRRAPEKHTSPEPGALEAGATGHPWTRHHINPDPLSAVVSSIGSAVTRAAGRSVR